MRNPSNPPPALVGVPRSRGARLAAAVSASAFSLLLVGTNEINPLLPTYRRDYGFDSLTISLTYVSYVVVLVVVLIVAARSVPTHWAKRLLIVSLLVACVGDLLMAHPVAASVLIGRALAGASAGIATGAAATLVVRAIGEAGRAVTATGNLVGAVIGIGFAQVMVALDPTGSIHTIFFIHAGACLVICALVIAVRQTRAAVSPVAEPRVVRLGLWTYFRHGNWRYLAVGSLGWVAISASVVFLPSLFAARELPIAASAGLLVLMASSAAVQLSNRAIARALPWGTGTIALAVGAAGVVAAGVERWDGAAVVFMALLGAGIGVSYRLSLTRMSAGADPVHQGGIASFYAAFTYAVTAVTVLTAGDIGNVVGLEALTAVFFGAVAVAAVLITPWAPSLRSESRLTSSKGRVVSSKIS